MDARLLDAVSKLNDIRQSLGMSKVNPNDYRLNETGKAVLAMR